MIFIDEEKRSELPDSEFGIESKRKFPLNTAEHVCSAIKLFGHADEADKKHLAKRIMSKAKEYNISVVENKPLARIIYHNVDIGMEIPPELYYAVAEILASVLRTNNR